MFIRLKNKMIYCIICGEYWQYSPQVIILKSSKPKHSAWGKICLHDDLIAAHRARRVKAMNKGIRVGYARVSTSSQKLDLQLERLADCDRTFHKKVSGKSAKNRPGPQNALNFVREGDVFVVTKLDYRILQTQQNKNGQPHFDVVVSVSDYTEDRINPSFFPNQFRA